MFLATKTNTFGNRGKEKAKSNAATKGMVLLLLLALFVYIENPCKDIFDNSRYEYGDIWGEKEGMRDRNSWLDTIGSRLDE